MAKLYSDIFYKSIDKLKTEKYEEDPKVYVDQENVMVQLTNIIFSKCGYFLLILNNKKNQSQAFNKYNKVDSTLCVLFDK